MAAKRRHKRPDEIRREQAASREIASAEQGQQMDRGAPGRPMNPRDPQGDRQGGGKHKR